MNDAEVANVHDLFVDNPCEKKQETRLFLFCKSAVVKREFHIFHKKNDHSNWYIEISFGNKFRLFKQRKFASFWF